MSMKRIFTLAVITSFFFVSTNSFSQQKAPSFCSTDEVEEMRKKTDPEYLKNALELEKFTQDFINSGKARQKASGSFIIPVVFHCITTNGGTGTITLEQVENALQQVNENFQGSNYNWDDVEPEFANLRDTLDITFCLAQIDPDGNPTNGITIHADETAFYDGRNAAAVTQYAWDNTKYMEVYTLGYVEGDGNSGRSGYAELPSMTHTNANEARIVYNYKYLGWGGSSTQSETDRWSSIFTHEIGHWLNLRHTFLNGCSSPGDYVDDTPYTSDGGGSLGCAGSSCSSTDNGNNYMSYNTGCYSMFTIGQMERLLAAMNHDSRKTIWAEESLIETGCKEGTLVPTAKFSSDLTAICTGETVQFENQSRGFPTAYEWTFEGGTPATSTDEDPSVVYNTSGVYTVTLKASSNAGEHTEEKIGYIQVGTASSLPLAEGFEGTTFPPAGWSIANPDNSHQWAQNSSVGHAGSSKCLVMSNVSNSVQGETDDLIIAPYDFTGKETVSLNFYLAYTQYDATSPDELVISVSTDCGNTWTEEYRKTHTDLETFVLNDGPQSNDWTPTQESHWRQELIDLTSYIGEDYVQIRFRNISGYGTNIFIDDINLDGTTGFRKLSETSVARLNVFPNPATGIFNIHATLIGDNNLLTVKNMIGKTIYEEVLNSGKKQLQTSIDLTDFADGVYFIQIQGSNTDLVKKLIKK